MSRSGRDNGPNLLATQLVNNAIVLLSGGLDSCTILAMAKAEGLKPYALTFRYGQRHEVEIEAGRKVAKAASVAEHRIIDIDLRQMGKSALTDSIDVPKGRSFEEMEDGIPVTYVPARNTIFLSFALGWAEVIGAWDIFIGVNAGDYAGYPDCRREYIAAFEQLANLATKAAIEGTGRYQIHTPIIEMTKAQIIAKGHAMGVDFGLTSSCYDPSPAGIACGLCDACLLRRKGFEENNTVDPAPYQNIPEP